MKNREDVHDTQVVKRARSAVRFAIEKKRTMGIPAVVYDRKTGNICHLNEDGSTVVITQRMSRGRYSERIGK